MRLREYKQWCLWRIDMKQDGTSFKRPTNEFGIPIGVNDIHELTTWETAKNVVDTKRIQTYGTGFIFCESDPFVGIDLDECLEDYTPKDWVLPILEKFQNTYIEYSPGLAGLKIYCVGKKPHERCNTTIEEDGKLIGAIECYSKQRFFTFTGDRFPGAGEEVLEQQEEIDWLFKTYLPEFTQPLVFKPQFEIAGDLEQRARNYAAKIERPLPGGRNLKCYKLAGHLIAVEDPITHKRLDHKFIVELVHQWNNSLPEPMSPSEVDGCIRNASKSKNPRPSKISSGKSMNGRHEDIDLSEIMKQQSFSASSRPECGTKSNSDGEQKPGHSSSEEPFPLELCQVPGMIGEFVEYCKKTCIARQPALALGAAICLQGVLCGRKVVCSLDNRPNIYIIGTAATGGGKENPRKMINRILVAVDGMNLGSAENPRSGSSLVKLLEEHPAKLLMIDEIGRYFRSNRASDRMSHQAEVIDQLLKLYSEGEGPWAGAQYADSKRNVIVDRPQLSLFGTTVPGHLWDNMEIAQATDGFLSRVILIEGDIYPEDGDMKPLTPPPESILAHCRAWIKRTEGNLSGISISDTEEVVQHTDAALARLKEIRQQAKNREIHKTEEELSLASRLMQNTAKLALIYACSRTAIEPVIDLEAVNWGFALSDYSRRKVLYACGYKIHESGFSRRQQRVVEWMRSQRDKPIALTDYTYKFKNWRPMDRDEVLKNMITTGMVTTSEETNSDTERARIILRLTI